MRLKLLVLGAGPAGTGAAFKAAQRGASVTLLERSDRVGGAAGSFELAAQRVDFGSHRLHPSIDPAIAQELNALMGGDLQLRQRRGRIRLQGRWVPFPLTTDSLRALPIGFAARIGRDSLGAPLRKPSAENFAAVLEAKLGPTISRSFYLPYARKIWGRDPTELAAEQARRRVSADSPLKMARRIFSGGGGTGRSFWYPRRGYGQITETLASAAVKAGAELRSGSSVSGLSFDDGGAEAILDDGTCMSADMVWSTLPVTAMARMTAGAPTEVLEAAAALNFRSMVLVYLVLPVDRYTAFDAHYLPESWTPVTRISEPKNYRDGDDPAGRTILCAEIPCDVGDPTWAAADVALADVVIAALEGSGLPSVHPTQVHTERISHAYPIYDQDYERHFRALDGWATGQQHLVTFGRQGLFAHDNLHHALAMAWAAAGSLGNDGSFNASRWADARRRFETHVVED